MSQLLIQNVSLKQYLVSRFPKLLYLLTGKQFIKERLEIRRLLKLPRRVPAVTSLFGKPFHLTDAASFLSMYEEIFISKLYSFRSSGPSPLIIDCGANVGVSVLFFKKEHPGARILAFEPDPTIFKVLKKNVELNGLTGVELVNKAVWTTRATIPFAMEGGASGRIGSGNEGNVVKVETISLRDVIDKKIDLLKIDIEGAEYEVLKDCREKLRMVEHLFIEYHSSEKSEQKLHEILGILTEEGFRYHIKEAYTAPFPFLERPVMLGMDLQLNIFAYRPR